jgi:signal peptidase
MRRDSDRRGVHRTARRTARSTATRTVRRRFRSAVEVCALVALLGILFLTWPQTLGGRVAYVMVSGRSMEPTMHLGDVAVLRRRSTYRRGDIVAYHVPRGEVGQGAVVIHRIVGGDATRGFVTRGDHNAYDDPWHPHSTDIVGSRWVLLAGAGRWLVELRTPMPLAAFAAMLAAFTSYELSSPRGRRRTRRPASTSLA